ncbi:MAG TPA: DUF47 family protein [bacterium]|nr:DUF47 family protein [bacterium]
MILRFFVKEANFFDLFEKQVQYAVDAASAFKEMMSRGLIDDAALRKIRDIEHAGDDATHMIFDQLNKTFITPFDREDIHALAKELDNVIDTINTIVSRMVIYKLTAGNKNMIEFSLVIEESVSAVARVIKGMRDMRNLSQVMDSCVEINRLENVGDSMRDRVFGELFDTEKDPITLIKWKEIYQEAETVLDICEDVTHVVETILVKQA